MIPLSPIRFASGSPTPRRFIGQCLCLIVLACSVGFQAAHCSSPYYSSGENEGDEPADTSSFQQRSEALLRGILRANPAHAFRGKFAYWQAQALLATGQVDEGIGVIEANLATDLDDHQGDIFVVWAVADTYVRWQHVLPEAVKAQFRRQLTGYAGYDSGTTENHRLMLATARLLAAQAWPNASFASSFRRKDPTGRRFLLRRMQQYVHEGTVEFDSPAYHTHYLGPMRSLADLAQDEDVRHRAALTAEWLLLENAGEWLDGHWLSGSLRHKSYYDGQRDFLSADYVLWLYFGASFEPDFADEKAVFAVQAAVSPYRLPAGVAAIATDRRSAVVHRETDVWQGRHHYGMTYLNKRYGLYSVIEDYKVHTVFGNQYHRWAVQWLSDADKSTLYVKHPHRKTGEDGTTGFEQVLQHEGTLLAVYAISERYPVTYVQLRTPGGYTAVLDESERGDLFLHYGAVLIALRLTEPFAWDPRSDVLDHPAQRLGVVVETALPEAYPGTAAEQLDAFKRDVQVHTPVLSTVRPTPTLAYTTRQGTTLRITFDGDRLVNGAPVDLAAWPLLDNPWMHQAVGDDRLVVSSPTQRITYDFSAWTKRNGGNP